MKKPPVPFRKNELLSRHTSFHVGGPVKYFFEPREVEELGGLLRFLHEQRIKPVILGGGTNLLVSDKPETRVVIAMKGLAHLDSKGTFVRARAGGSLSKLVRKTVKDGLAGLEGLAGIPGTIGGAIMMNAGGKWGAVSDTIIEVETMDALGRRRTFSASELNFAYRRGPFKRRIVTGATFRLKRAAGGVRKKFARILSEKKLSQPLGAKSAGCAFLNPPGASAGALIDRAGLKGFRVGGAEVSRAHANFIINVGGATNKDISELLDIVKRKVYTSSGVILRMEIRTIQ